jgi:hypothetical protein
MGSLRLLADSFPPSELNKKGFSLYAEFRPEVNGWGKKGTLHLKNILQLRKKQPAERKDSAEQAQPRSGEPFASEASAISPPEKRQRGMSLEEFEAFLDAEEA